MPSAKFSLFFRHYFQITIILVLVVCALVFLFLYQNVYQTMVAAKEIMVLQPQVIPESFDQNLLQQTQQSLIKKQQETNVSWEKLTNPF